MNFTNEMKKVSEMLSNTKLAAERFVESAKNFQELSASKFNQGLYGKYVIGKANGEPVDPNAFYFVLRLDSDDEWGDISRDAISKVLVDIKKIDPVLADDLLNFINQKNYVSKNGVFIDVNTLGVSHQRWLAQNDSNGEPCINHAKESNDRKFIGCKDLGIHFQNMAFFKEKGMLHINDPDYFCRFVAKSKGITFVEKTPVFIHNNISSLSRYFRNALLSLPPFNTVVEWEIRNADVIDKFSGSLTAYSSFGEKIEISGDKGLFSFRLKGPASIVWIPKRAKHE